VGQGPWEVHLTSLGVSRCGHQVEGRSHLGQAEGSDSATGVDLQLKQFIARLGRGHLGIRNLLINTWTAKGQDLRILLN